ncbi:MAG: hypothetical protein ACQER9_04895, partial [Nanobdellota archaeon]
ASFDIKDESKLVDMLKDTTANALAENGKVTYLKENQVKNIVDNLSNNLGNTDQDGNVWSPAMLKNYFDQEDVQGIIYHKDTYQNQE